MHLRTRSQWLGASLLFFLFCFLENSAALTRNLKQNVPRTVRDLHLHSSTCCTTKFRHAFSLVSGVHSCWLVIAFKYFTQKLKIGVLITIFEKDGRKSLSGTQRAQMALLAAQDINNRDDILPSYEVPLFSFTGRFER